MADTINENLRDALADRYEIERRIAQGGMATVYLARDLQHNRLVAIKVLNTELSVTLGPERFRREIRLIRTMDHPSILPLYDSGESGGSLYYVMPYVNGESLAARVQRETQLAVSEAVRIAVAVAGALEYAHKRGIVHRDVTPCNILLEDGRVLVTDFGIARAFGGSGEQPLTQTGVSTGTPTYMSPEQALAEREIDGRSDIYSLGCVLYEMLVGQPPFVGPTAQAIVARQMLDDVPSLTIVRSAIPDELEDAVLRALSKTPADRYSTAAEFAEALNASLLTGGQTLGRAERRSRPRITGARRERRNRARVRATVIAAVMLLAAVASYGWFRSRPGAVAATVGFPPSRIAVLYFADQSRSAQLGYVADGLTENLIDELRQVKNLDVISPNGVAPFRGVDISRDSVARVLGAGTLVEGRIDDAGANRLRVDVRLIDGNSGAELGSRASFEQSRADLLGIRDTLTSRVAMLVRERVGEEVQLRQQRASTRNPAAWSLVRQGEARRREAIAAHDRGELGEMRRAYSAAESLWARAQSLDQSWQEPSVQRGLAAAWRAGVEDDRIERARWIDTGLVHADRALALDPRSAAARELRGRLRYQRYYYQLTADPAESTRLLRDAEADLRAAVTTEPSRANAWYLLSHLNYMRLDIAEAKLAARRAYEEDAYLATTPSILWTLFNASYLLEQFSDAVQWCELGHRRFGRDSRFLDCQLMLLASRARDPDIGAAWRLVRELELLTPKALWELKRRKAQMYAAVVLARANRADSARRVIAMSQGSPELDSEGELLHLEAFVRVTLGENEEAIRLLTRYFTNNPEPPETRGKVEWWWWRDLKQDPRYRALVGTT